MELIRLGWNIHKQTLQCTVLSGRYVYHGVNSD